MLQNLFQNVIEVTLATSVVIAVLLIFHPLIRKNYTAKWRYWVWAVLAIRLLIPFSPSLANIHIEITPPSQNIEFKMPVRNAEDFQLPSPLATPLSDTTNPFQFAEDSSIEHIIPKPRTITLNEILSIIWALGIAIFMVYHLAGYFLFKQLIFRFSRFVEDKRVTELWSEVKDEMSIGTNIPLFTCKKVQGPMMTGFFRPILLLPDLDYNNTDLQIILKHEVIHYKRKDIWYKLLLVCANAVHWFNPIVYLMAAKANKDVEIVCDSEVTKDSNTDYRKKYSETILSAIHKENLRKTAFSTYFYGGKRTMKERFSNIFDMRKKRKGMVAFLTVLISITIIGGIVACSTQNKGKDTGNNTDKIADKNAGSNTDENVDESTSAPDDAVNVVKRHLEAMKKNDYETWKSTLWPAEKNEQNFTPTFEKPGDLGVISLYIEKVEVSDELTRRNKEAYIGSELAQSNGWSDEYISENMIVVFAQYTVDYDNTKVPYSEGHLSQYFILVRDNNDSPWLIWSEMSPSDGNNQPVDISEFGNLSIGATMPEVDYASEKRIIFHSYFGLFVYDMDNERIYRSIDLKTIDSNYMQGSTHTEVSVSKDGKTVYIDNIGDGYDEFMYEYDVEKNKLTETKVKEISDRYLTGNITDKISIEKAGWVSTAYGQINEDIYAYLLLEEGSLYVGDLKLVVCNEKDGTRQTYSVFKPSATGREQGLFPSEISETSKIFAESLDFYIMTDEVGAIGCEYGIAKSAGAMTKEEMFEELEKIQGFIFDKFTTEELYVEFHFLKEKPRSITISCIANGKDEYPIEYSGYRIKVPTKIAEYAIFAELVYENGEQDTVFFSITVVQEHKTVSADTTPMKLSNDLEQSISQAILNYYAPNLCLPAC